MKNTPDNITELSPNSYFVFGSNLAGHHAGGAALYAKEHFGAEEGVGEGFTGQCYAFPTLTKELKERDHLDLKESVRRLSHCAVENPDKVFLLTRVGTGIAGYSPDYMASLFKGAPANIILPNGWTR